MSEEKHQVTKAQHSCPVLPGAGWGGFLFFLNYMCDIFGSFREDLRDFATIWAKMMIDARSFETLFEPSPPQSH